MYVNYYYYVCRYIYVCMYFFNQILLTICSIAQQYYMFWFSYIKVQLCLRQYKTILVLIIDLSN